MTKKILLSVFLFFVVLLMPAMAVELDPIPAGADIVVFVNNHSGLPLGDMLKAAPIPQMARQKLDEFINATSFNPFKDISRIQAMIKKGATKHEDNAVVILSGSFNKDKIMGFIKNMIGKEIAEEKNGNMTLYKSNNGKGGLCFIDNSKVAIGTLPSLNVFIEAMAGKEVSKEYDDFKQLLNDKTYAAVMVGGKEFLKKSMEKNHERRQAHLERMQRASNPVAKWLESYLSEGVEPQGVFAQLMNSKIEAKVLYNRAESKNNVIQCSFEIIDPKITIEKMFGEFLQVVSELPAPAPKEKAPPANTGRW